MTSQSPPSPFLYQAIDDEKIKFDRYNQVWFEVKHKFALIKPVQNVINESINYLPLCAKFLPAWKIILMKVSCGVRFLVRRLAQVYMAAAKWTRACIVWNILQNNYMPCSNKD